jgi:hypothetical protein
MEAELGEPEPAPAKRFPIQLFGIPIENILQCFGTISAYLFLKASLSPSMGVGFYGVSG